MNAVEVMNFFDKVSNGTGLSVQFQESISPLNELNLKDQKVLEEARAWLNLRAVRNTSGPYGERDDKKGVLISMTRTEETFHVYEKIVNEKDKPIKGDALIKDEVICKTYTNSASAMTAVIKSIKKYCPERAHEFIKFS